VTSAPVDTDPLTRAPSAPVGRHAAFEGVRVLLVAARLVVGMALLRRVDALRLLAALALTVGPLLVWLVSRTAGVEDGKHI
jgi:hypothetical protein